MEPQHAPETRLYRARDLAHFAACNRGFLRGPGRSKPVGAHGSFGGEQFRSFGEASGDGIVGEDGEIADGVMRRRALVAADEPATGRVERDEARGVAAGRDTLHQGEEAGAVVDGPDGDVVHAARRGEDEAATSRA